MKVVHVVVKHEGVREVARADHICESLDAEALRVAQGASVEVILREALPVQVDGEPWLQPPAVVHVSSGGKIPFVIGRGETRNVPEMAHVRVRSVDIPEEDTHGARATSSGTTTGRE